MRALVRILLGGLSGSGQRSFQQLATHRPHENKEIAYGILSGKVVSKRWGARWGLTGARTGFGNSILIFEL